MARNTPRSAPRRTLPPQPRPNAWRRFWGDADQRRALLLSVLLHAGLLLGLVWLYLQPPADPPEELIVLELTPPQGGEAQRDAAAVDTPAPPGPEAQAAGNAASQTSGVPDAPAAETQAEAPPEAELESEATAQTDATPEAQAGTPPEPDVSSSDAEVAQTPVTPPARAPAAQAPQIQAQVPEPQPNAAQAQLPAPAPSSTLPEIEAPQVAPQPLEESIALPTPEAQATVAPAQQIAVAPQVEVAEGQPLPTPSASAEIATQAITVPEARAEVTPAAPLPDPQASATVVTRDVPTPQVGTTVAAAAPIPQPSVSTSVATRDVPQPQVGATVAEAAPIPQPSVSGSAVAAQPVPQPQAGATVAAAQPLTVTPGVQVGVAVPVPTPGAAATVTSPAASAQGGEAGPEGAGAVQEGSQTAAAADVGDGPSSAQPTADPEASAAGQGAASDGSGVAESGVANVQSYEVTVDQPLAVLIDNADAAYPQQGLAQASSVFEMPVEGGLTRLMSVYTDGDPTQVGPIRSARDYFLEAALAMNGTLVHVGGAPSTVGRIASQQLATVDALQEGALFAQAPDRLAPHSTFATGPALRDAVGRLEQQVNGTLFVPPEAAANAASVTVNYSADYSSGFRYVSDLDQYRWVRSGADAVDVGGTAVTADAVVVAQVTAFPYPDDPEGRLYLPYSGGAATLYLRGKAIPGSWTPEGGFRFVTAAGEPVDLRPFKAWLLFAPESADVSSG